MKINRSEFLQTLSSVQPGLASVKEVIEQSACFVLQNGEVISFNEEISVRAPSGLDDSFVGAVHARPLLEVLSKYPDDEIDISCTNGHLIIKGKRRKSRVRMEHDVLLPLDSVEQPQDWIDLNHDFTDAVSVVQECASTDETTKIFTCIHIHPNWIESCDNFQAARYTLETGIKTPTLVRKDSLAHILSLGVTRISERHSWLHFQGNSGVTLSCRKWLDEYKDLTPMLDVVGEDLVLPKGLSDAATRGQVFSAENRDSNLVKIDLIPGKLRLKAVGINGDHEEFKDVKYSGKPLSFLISPKLLEELTKRHTKCQVSPNRLKVDGGKFAYVCLLFASEEKKKRPKKEKKSAS